MAEPIARLLGVPENIRAGSVRYVQIVCGMSIARMFYNTSAAVLRAVGDSRTPLIFLIICSVLNVLLDLLFVVVLGMDGLFDNVNDEQIERVTAKIIKKLEAIGAELRK